MDIGFLETAVRKDAAFRRLSRLQPIGGVGDKIFPPTYPGERNTDPARHVFEQRRVNGKDVWCVLVDSVQSQANRMEESLLAAANEDDEAQRIPLPYVTVDFSGNELQPLERITSLDAPHRVYDAILRDSQLGKEPFMKSDDGRRLASAKPADASALLELSPTALVFGAWHSQGEGGGFGAKFPRVIVSEIIAFNTPIEQFVSDRRTGEMSPRTSGRRTGSRIDPLGILRNVEIFKGSDGWNTDKETAGKGTKKVRPSEINHGNIAPSVESLGVTCDYLEHNTTITLAGVRRLRFGGGERDTAGRMLIVALGLLAIAEQDVRGYALRSRCDLVCDGPVLLELVSCDGTTSTVDFDRETIQSLYRDAYNRAKDAGFSFRSLTLTPQDKLVDIIRASRRLALEGKGGDEENDQ